MNISFAEPPPPRPTVPCPKCPRLFFNNQGLGVHVKTEHRGVAKIGITRWCSKAGKGGAPSAVLPWGGVPSGRCWHVTFNHEARVGAGSSAPKGSVTFVLQPLREGVEKNVVSDGFPGAEPARKQTRGAETRRSYSMREKASIVEELRELEGRKQEVRAHFNMTPLIYLEHKPGISRSNISKWQQEEHTIVADAADKVKGALMKKTSPDRSGGFLKLRRRCTRCTLHGARRRCGSQRGG